MAPTVESTHFECIQEAWRPFFFKIGLKKEAKGHPFFSGLPEYIQHTLDKLIHKTKRVWFCQLSQKLSIARALEQNVWFV